MERRPFTIKDKSFTIGLMQKEEMRSLFPLIEELNPSMELALFEERLTEMQANRFNCIGVWQDDKLVACCGFWILIKFYNGRHVEPDNVAVLTDYRNFGLGQIMMNYVHEYAKTIGCTVSELNAYVSNNKAHKFYFKDDYKILGFHFRKDL